MEFEYINNIYNTEFTNKLLENKKIFYEIYEACGNKFMHGCGSYLFDGSVYKYCDLMYEKQELLYNSVKNVKNVLEIGTYMGHSLLIMLLSNPDLKITCIDISNEYTFPAVTILNKYFNNAIKFIHGDSLSILEKIEYKFDFFHIDGHHEDSYIQKEFDMIKTMSSNPILKVMFDDADCLTLLVNKIRTQCEIVTDIRPECAWTNIYFELKDSGIYL